MRVANELTLPKARRRFDDGAHVLDLFSQELHCFEVSAISKAVQDVMDAENVWPDVELMLPRMFLPSPVTWLETITDNDRRMAWVLEDRQAGAFRMSMVATSATGAWSMPMCDFRPRPILEIGERVILDPLPLPFIKNAENERDYRRNAAAISAPGQIGTAHHRKELTAKIGLIELRLDSLRHDIDKAETMLETLPDNVQKCGIVMTVMMLDLINTPGLIGLRQHDPHRGLAKRLASLRAGNYPLRGWSEVVLKSEVQVADDAEHRTGPAFHKCLHFVRSHQRRYRDGHVTIIPGHWRGDPALGIKRTRYRVAPNISSSEPGEGL